MSAVLTMVDDRQVAQIEFPSREEAAQFAANLNITVGTVTYGDGSVEYSAYVGDHLVGYFETPRAARIRAARFDRRSMLHEVPVSP